MTATTPTAPTTPPAAPTTPKAGDILAAPPAATTAPTTPPAAPTTPPAAPPGEARWFDGLPEPLRITVQAKGWGSIEDVVKSYQHLESFKGVPPDKLLKVPNPEDAEGWAKLHERLRPKAPEEYGLKAEEGGDPEFAGQAAEAFHKAGLTVAQAKSLTDWFNTAAGKSTEAEARAKAEKIANEDKEIKTEWADKWDANVMTARKAVAAMGFSPDQLNELQESMGLSGVMRLFHTIGSRLGEHQLVEAGKMVSPNSVEAAKVKLAQNLADPAWKTAYMGGSEAHKTEMQRLQKIIAGE